LLHKGCYLILFFEDRCLFVYDFGFGQQKF